MERPRSTPAYSPHLGFEIDPSSDRSFVGGDTVTGSLVRTSPLVSTDAWLEVQLFGHAKAQVTTHVFSGKPAITYKSCFPFFETCTEQTRQLLYHGPIHITKDSAEAQSWRFSLTIPHDTAINLDRVSEKRRKACLIPMDSCHVSDHGLPSTFSNEDFTSCISYYLEATLHYKQQDKTRLTKAWWPIRIRHLPTSSPISNWKLHTQQWRHAVYSFRLVPGISLSFKQRSKSFFKPSSTPQHCHSIDLIVPTSIQIDHPSWIPIKLRIRPILDSTSTILHGVSQKLVLNSLKMYLKSKSSTSFSRDIFYIDKPVIGHSTEQVDLCLERAFDLLQEPIVIVAQEDSEPVDVGAALQLRLTQTGLFAGERRLSRVKPIVADFTTFNMELGHSCNYEFSLTLVDEVFVTRSKEIDTTIIAQPMDTAVEAPPAFSEAENPPAFEEVIREDAALTSSISAEPTALLAVEMGRS